LIHCSKAPEKKNLFGNMIAGALAACVAEVNNIDGLSGIIRQ
jgi:hypothetical protein